MQVDEAESSACGMSDCVPCVCSPSWCWTVLMLSRTFSICSSTCQVSVQPCQQCTAPVSQGEAGCQNCISSCEQLQVLSSSKHVAMNS